MILQATVERWWMPSREWRLWGVMDLEVKAGAVYDQALAGTLRSYLGLGRSPPGFYRVGKDSHLGIFAFEVKDDGESVARPITRDEFSVGNFI